MTQASPQTPDDTPQTNGDVGWLGFGFVAGFVAAWFLLSHLSPHPSVDQAELNANRETASERATP